MLPSTLGFGSVASPSMGVDPPAGPAYSATMNARRPALAGFASASMHGVALLAVVLTVREPVISGPEVELTPIEVVEAPPAPAPALAGSPAPSSPTASAGKLGRRGRDAPQRSMSRAPATTDPFADVVVSYDAPTGPARERSTGDTGSGRGRGLVGDGASDGTGGVFGLGSVPPAPTSQARPPRAKEDYRRWNFRADRRFAGATVQVELRIDPAGRVRDVRVLRGVDESIDKHAAGLARRFEFHPALDDAGDPTWGLHHWEFVLLGDALQAPLQAPARRW
jgi:TonB family protein